jgi:hypothetical protein
MYNLSAEYTFAQYQPCEPFDFRRLKSGARQFLLEGKPVELLPQDQIRLRSARKELQVDQEFGLREALLGKGVTMEARTVSIKTGGGNVRFELLPGALDTQVAFKKIEYVETIEDSPTARVRKAVPASRHFLAASITSSLPIWDATYLSEVGKDTQGKSRQEIATDKRYCADYYVGVTEGWVAVVSLRAKRA